MKRLFTALLVMLFLLTGCSGTNSQTSHNLARISLSGDYQTDFRSGDTFTYEGMIVTAHYDDKTSKAVNNYQVSTPDMIEVGIKKVYVTYQENKQTAEIDYEISVLPKDTISLSYIVLSSK